MFGLLVRGLALNGFPDSLPALSADSRGKGQGLRADLGPELAWLSFTRHIQSSAESHVCISH